jgi:hypothetical protein
MLLKYAWLGTRQFAIRAHVATLPRLGGGFGTFRFRGSLELLTGLPRRFLAVLVRVLSRLRRLGNNVVRRGLFLGLDEFRLDLSGRHLLELFV